MSIKSGNSILSRMRAILTSFTSLIGTPADTDVSTDIANLAASIVARPTCKIMHDTVVANATYETALSITGSGEVYEVSGCVDADTQTIQIILDGNVTLTGTNAETSDVWVRGTSGNDSTGISGLILGAANTPYQLGWKFSTSLVVKHKINNGANNSYISILYGEDA